MYWQFRDATCPALKKDGSFRELTEFQNRIFSARFSGFLKTCKSFTVHQKLPPLPPKKPPHAIWKEDSRSWQEHNVLCLVFFFFFSELLLRSRYLVLLSASHHVEEEIYAALVDDGHAVQESYFICRHAWGKKDTLILLTSYFRTRQFPNPRK